uniref:T-cell differentiation antigen CD6 isoform X13 n=1 Tax=Geotrypetes seraphini TaxID=260995 RepID=A0A6P8P3I4_GEOSA|nr:T-cell differentiation antigen CD6 isoform X13 [Geotrypetes seraphini]
MEDSELDKEFRLISTPDLTPIDLECLEQLEDSSDGGNTTRIYHSPEKEGPKGEEHCGWPEPTESLMDKQDPFESTEQLEQPAQPLVRLVNGTSRCGGTVQLRHQREWLALCSEFAELMIASLICKELQCGTARSSNATLHGKGTPCPESPRVVTNRTSAFFLSVHCPGSEEGLENCSLARLSSESCPSGKAAIISCTGSLGLLTTTVTMERTEEMTSRFIHGRTDAPELVKNGTETSKDPTLRSICIILAVLLLGTLLAFAFFVFRRRKKQVAPVLVHHSLQTSNMPSIESNDYRNPASIAAKIEEPALSSAHHLSEDSDYEDYDFSSKPPLALSTFYNSLRYKPIDDHVQQKNTPMAPLQEGYQDADRPDSQSSLSEKVQEQENYYNQPISSPYPAPTCVPSAASPQASRATEDTSSTSSEEEGWYENFRLPQSENLLPISEVPSSGPQVQEDATDCEYDDIDAST